MGEGDLEDVSAEIYEQFEGGSLIHLNPKKGIPNVVVSQKWFV